MDPAFIKASNQAVAAMTLTDYEKAIDVELAALRPSALHAGRSTGGAPQGVLHAAHSMGGTPRGPLHGGSGRSFFYPDVRSILMVL